MKERTRLRRLKKAKNRANKMLNEKIWVLKENGYSLTSPPPATSYLFGYFQSARQLTINLGVDLTYMPPTKKVDSDFYLSREWKSLRYDVLRINNGKCELCGASKHTGAQLHVDHIKPRSRYPDLELEASNLQVLCGDCNIGKGNRDQTDWRE